MKLKIGQRVQLRKVQGEGMRRRKGTVVEEYEHHYVIRTDIGYMESISKYGESVVKIL